MHAKRTDVIKDVREHIPDAIEILSVKSEITHDVIYRDGWGYQHREIRDRLSIDNDQEAVSRNGKENN